MHVPRTYWLNADFDLRLRAGGRATLAGPAIERQVAELTLQGLLGTADGDATLVALDPPGELLDHLGRCGLHVPRLLRRPAIDPATRLVPFGWSDEAIALNARHERPVEHPSLEVVRRVNGRSFALQLERELTPDAPGGTLVRDERELGAALPPRGPAVLKAEHGNASLGNRLLRTGRPTLADRRWIATRLAEDGRLLVERWLPRTRDWSTVFDVPFDAARCRVHETRCTSGGGLVGALFEPRPDCPWLDELHALAPRVAAGLEAAGYAGPVCLDSIEWDDGGTRRLRPIVDLNARRAMSDGAYRAWRASFPERAVLYRFAPRRGPRPTNGCRELLRRLGDDAYRAEARRGVLPVSPVARDARLVLLVVGRDRADVDALDRRTLERLAGTPA